MIAIEGRADPRRIIAAMSKEIEHVARIKLSH